MNIKNSILEFYQNSNPEQLSQMSYTLCLDNYRVYEFYRSRPYLNFEDINIYIIELFEKIFEKTNPDISATENSQNILHLLENIHKDNFNSIIHKLSEFKKEYIEDLKINLNIHTSDKITPTINQFNQNTQDKIQIMFNEKVSILENKIEQVVESAKKNMDTQICLSENVATLIKKMENSSFKGAISENLLYNNLLNLFSNAEIIYTNQEAHHGDIMLKRKNKNDILFENKDYNYNVPKKEIDKFIEDINIHNCCGIMLSQKSGISLKDNFEIEIHKGHVVIYLHNVQYSVDIIKTAIHIIDHLQGEINIDTSNTINIDKNMLDSINIEYKNFAIQKLEHIEYIKIMSNKLIKQAEDLKHISIESLLHKYYNSSINKEIICVCGRVWNSRRSLASHQKTCEKFKIAQNGGRGERSEH
jgi:hypothetical protein